MPPPGDDPISELLGALLDGSHLLEPDRLPSLIRSVAAAAGWQVQIYLADYEQRELVLLDGAVAGREVALSIDGTLAGRCFRTLEPVAIPAPERGLWVPLLDGVERLGVLRVQLAARAADPADPSADPPGGTGILVDDRTRKNLRWFSYLSAHLLASKSSYGDALHLPRLSRPRTPASELVWSLLPPLTVASEGVVIAGVLEPSWAVAGDVFDYSLTAERADIAIADATGHDLRSAAIGAITLSTYRTIRRQGADLPAIVDRIDDVLAEFAAGTFATGVFGQLDRASGVFRWVNAGHPSPLLLRHGKVIKSLEGGRRILLGIGGYPAVVAEERLEPGDWLVLYTDGVTEARDEERRFFGLDRLIDIVERCAADGQAAAETLRRVTHAVLDHQRGVLQDDATLVIVQWMTGEEHALTS